jgi:hypothetical protein
MIEPQTLLKEVEQSLALVSILNGQLVKMKRELEIIVHTGQAVAPNVDALQLSVSNMLARGGGRAEVDGIFLDWRQSAGLLNGEPQNGFGQHVNGANGHATAASIVPAGANGHAPVNGVVNGHHHPKVNGHHRPKLEAIPREQTAEDHSYLRFL